MSPLLSDTVVSPIVGGASADTRLEEEERLKFDSHIPSLVESAEDGYVGRAKYSKEDITTFDLNTEALFQ